MITEDIKARMFAAMKAKRIVEKEILRVAMGELTREGSPAEDEEALKILKKLVKSNEETLAMATDEHQRETLREEIAVLSEFLPKTLSVEQIIDQLGSAAEAIRGAANDGQATGVAMKALRAAGHAVDGKDVSRAVQQLRG